MTFSLKTELEMTLKHEQPKEKTGKLDFIKNKSLLHQRTLSTGEKTTN